MEAPDVPFVVSVIVCGGFGVGTFKTPSGLRNASPVDPNVVRPVNGITGVGIFNTPLTRVAASPEAPVVVKLVNGTRAITSLTEKFTVFGLSFVFGKGVDVPNIESLDLAVAVG